MTTRITFVQPHAVYAPGEMAGFPDDVAAALVAAGKAVSPVVVADPAPMIPARPSAAAEIAKLGTGTMNPDAAATLYAISPHHFTP